MGLDRRVRKMIRGCAKAIALFKRLLYSNLMFSFCVLIGIGVAAVAVILISFWGLSFWRELEIVTAISVLTAVIGLGLQVASEFGKKREENRQNERKDLDARFVELRDIIRSQKAELREEMRSHFATIDGRLDVVEGVLATHTHQNLADNIRAVEETAIENKTRLGFVYPFYELRQEINQIKELLKSVKSNEQNSEVMAQRSPGADREQ